MLSSVPYLIHFYLVHGDKTINQPFYERDTKFWVVYLNVYTMSTVTFHTISILLTVFLACFRYFYLKAKNPNNKNNSSIRKSSSCKRSGEKSPSKFCSNYRLAASLLTIFVFGMLVCLPTYLYPKVDENFIDDDLNNVKNKYYFIDQSDLNIQTNGFIFKLMFYSQGIVGKLLPCILLFVFSILLIRSLTLQQRNRDNLSVLFHERHRKDVNKLETSIIQKGDSVVHAETAEHKTLADLMENRTSAEPDNSIIKLNSENFHVANKKRRNRNSNIKLKKENSFFINSKRKSFHDKYSTTVMLTMVCILFLISELPQSILIFLIFICNDQFYSDVYLPLGDVLDMIALINSSVSFILYVLMSSAFRETLYILISNVIPRKGKKGKTNETLIII